ncbi:unnamed protein product [Scytosiphon promiscuus]
MTAATAGGRKWKCGVCSAKAGDLVCGGCVTREAERRREKRAERLDSLQNVRETAAFALQERGIAVQQEARLQKEAADESCLKDQIREVTTRVAGERIKVASAAFALKHHRDLLAAAESHLSREQTSAVELKEALLDGLRRHTEDAERTLRQRRWRKVVQLFVLLPVEPSIPPLMRVRTAARSSRSASSSRGRGDGPSPASPMSAKTAAASALPAVEGATSGHGGGGGTRQRSGLPSDSGGGGSAAVSTSRAGARGGQVVSGVSTLVDLPLPNNGDYSQVPPDVLMASLALLARLVVGVASCLGVSLPHPLFPTTSTRYATISVDSSPRERSSQYPLCPLSKLAEIGVMGSASSVCNTMGAFETALDLLRNDVVHLCVEGAKVPVDSLWPAEALLLNLWELQQHAMSELQRLSPMVDVPLPMPRDLPEPSEGSHHRAAEVGRGGRGPGGGRGIPASGSGGDRASSSSSSSYGQDGRRRGRTRGMRSRLGLGLGLSSAAISLPSPPPPPGAEAEGEGREDDYEFVGGGGGGDVDGDGVGGEGRRRVEEGDPGIGRGWSSWGSRLAAAGSGGGGLG